LSQKDEMTDLTAKIRKEHNYSQAVFSRMLSTRVRTLRNWEQGRSEPNAQAKLDVDHVPSHPQCRARPGGT
jgi:putative transcriptional regulator